MLLPALSFAGKNRKEFTKEIKKEFEMNSDGTVEIINQFGTVNIYTWEKPQVHIDIKISVDAPNQEKADRILDLIEIEFSNQSDYVRAKTVKENQKKEWLTGWYKKITNNGYQVDYEVYMPIQGSVNLENRHGDTYLAALEGSAKIDQRYGHIKVDRLAGDLDLSLSYGNGNIGPIQNADIEVKYSNNLSFTTLKNLRMESKYSHISLEEADDLRIESKYDKYKVGNINNLRLLSKYDNFRVESVNNLEISGKYSDFKIGYLENSAEVEAEYGGVSFDKVSPKFNAIDVEGKHSRIDIDLDEASDYLLTGDFSYTRVDLPSKIDETEKRQDGNDFSIKARKGNSPKTIIKLKASYGTVIIH